MRTFSSLLLAIGLSLPAISHAQINLNGPNQQVKGVLPALNGGTGMSVDASKTGCLYYTAGVPSISIPNCGSSYTPPFTISGFSGGGQVEIGATVTNPAFSATYSATPNSATITNTDNIGSPLTLTTPFTSGTVTGSFAHTTSSAVTFSLTAIGSSTQVATQQIQWLPRTFAGVGTPGATGATASGSSAVLTGATGTLAGNNPGFSYATQSFTLNPSGQTLYLLLTGTGHTFSVNGFTTSFTSTPISFVNQYGATVILVLYTLPGTFTGTYSVVITG